MMNDETARKEIIELDPDVLENVTGGRTTLIKMKSNQHVRKGPGEEYGTLGTIRAHSMYAYLGSTQTDKQGRKWYKINYNGNEGWVCGKYATKS